MRLPAALALLALFLPAAAQAQEAIPTAQAAIAAPAPPAPPPPLGRDDRLDPVRDSVPMGPCGPLRTKPDGTIEKPSKQGHGEVMAAVGTHGYREAGASICQPIGDKGAAVTLDVDVGRYGRHR